jgi:hypothetical protein
MRLLSGLTMPKGRIWLAVMGAGATIMAIAIAAFVLAGGDDGGSTAPPRSDASRPTRTPTLPRTEGAPSETPPQVTPQAPGTPGPTGTGGDQPIGPPPAPRAGSLPENAGLSPEFEGLRSSLAAAVNAYHAQTGTEVAVAVTDLQTGQTLSVNGNRTQRTGCTIHMFALLAITHEFQNGRGSPDSVAGSVRIGIGNSYPPQVRAFLDTVYGDFRVGTQRARELMSSWGMTASLFDHVAYYGDGTQNNLLTALETNMILTKLYRGQLFDGEWTNYALSRLHEIKPGLNYMIPGQLPAEAWVAHKIGYYADSDGWVNADAGLVTFTGADGQQKAFAITYLSQRAPSQYTGYALASQLSRVAWDWFYARYLTSPPPPDTPTYTPRPPTNTPRPPTRTPTRAPTRTATPVAPTVTPTVTETP